MSKPKPEPKPARRGGPTQPEGERKARQRLLRLLPEVEALMVTLAAARGLSVSAYVAELVEEDAARATRRSARQVADAAGHGSTAELHKRYR